MMAEPDGVHFHHSLLVVDADDTLERVLVPVLRRHAAATSPVLMVVGERTGQGLRERLGPVADSFEWSAAEEFYQRLGSAFGGFVRYLREQSAEGRRVHVVAEPQMAADRVSAFLPYEAICNDVFPAYGCPVTCIWDGRQHSAQSIAEIRKVHGQQWSEQGRVQNPGYVPPIEYLNERLHPLPAVPARTDVDTVVWNLTELAACRAMMDRWASTRRVPETVVAHVVVATSEVVANGFRHGSAPVRIRAWQRDEDLIVQVDDSGGRPIPVDAGYRPPRRPEERMGLWVARQSADILITGTDAEAGRTTVWMRFPWSSSII